MKSINYYTWCGCILRPKKITQLHGPRNRRNNKHKLYYYSKANQRLGTIYELMNNNNNMIYIL